MLRYVQQADWLPSRFTGDLRRCPGLVYHYTHRRRLVQILSDGALKPFTERGVPIQRRGIVWFTRNHMYDAGALRPDPDRPGQVLTFQGMVRHYGPLARIVCGEEVAPHRMAELLRRANLQRTVAAGFGRAQSWVADRDWRGSFTPVLAQDWYAVELWDPDAANWLGFGSNEALVAALEPYSGQQAVRSTTH